MNNKNIITKTKIMGLVIVLLMGVLVGCPTEAPKEKKKGDDGGGGPLPEISISFSHIGSHEIVADVTANIALDGEVTFAITNKKDKPIIPAESTTDGFISRKITKGADPRKVYMAQRKANLPNSENLGTLGDKNTLHAAIMRDNTDYFLHIFYTKQGSGEVTHTSKPFKTTAHRNNTSETYFDMVKNIDLKIGEELLILIADVPKKTISGVSARKIKGDGEGYTLGTCRPDVVCIADAANGGKVMMFEDYTVFIYTTSYTIESKLIGEWVIESDTGKKANITVTKIEK